MNFRCSNCNYDHQVKKDSYYLNPKSGMFAQEGWYKDNRGQNYYATACLNCGTVHATTGAPLKALFGRPLGVEKYFTKEMLEKMVFDISREDNISLTHAFDGLGLPSIVVKALKERGYLQFLLPKQSQHETTHVSESEDTLENFFAVLKERNKNLSEVPQENIEKIAEMWTQDLKDRFLQSFTLSYTRYCGIYGINPRYGTSLQEYLQYALSKNEKEEAYAVAKGIFDVFSIDIITEDEILGILYYGIMSYEKTGVGDEIQRLLGNK